MNPGGFGLLDRQSVDGVQQMMDRQMRSFVDRHFPMTAAGRARAERAVDDFRDAHRALFVLGILQCHANRCGGMHQQIAARIDDEFRFCALLRGTLLGIYEILQRVAVCVALMS